MPGLSPELGSAVKGMQMGQTALSGLLPSSGNPRGGGAPLDPYSQDFRQAIGILNQLAQKLIRSDLPSGAGDSNDIAQMAVKLQRLSIDRQKEVAEQSMKQALTGLASSTPNVNGGGVYSGY
jgi:hypothetical protein